MTLEPKFYGDLVYMYKLKKSVGSNNVTATFIKIISHYKKIGHNLNVLQKTACLVVHPNTVGHFAFFLAAGGSDLRFNDGSDLKTYL